MLANRAFSLKNPYGGKLKNIKLGLFPESFKIEFEFVVFRSQSRSYPLKKNPILLAHIRHTKHVRRFYSDVVGIVQCMSLLVGC